MKFVKLLGLMLFASFVLFTSCEDERLTPYDDYKNGALPVISGLTQDTFSLALLDEAATAFDVDVDGQIAVNAVNLFASYNGGASSALESVTSFPSTVDVSAQDLIDLLGLSNGDISQGDVFTITMDMDTSEGNLAPNNSLSITVTE